MSQCVVVITVWEFPWDSLARQSSLNLVKFKTMRDAVSKEVNHLPEDNLNMQLPVHVVCTHTDVLTQTNIKKKCISKKIGARELA